MLPFVRADSDGNYGFVPDSGTPVDLYVCQDCGLAQLFVIKTG